MATRKKFSQLDEISELSINDIIAVSDDPSGTPISKKAGLQKLVDLLEKGYFARQVDNVSNLSSEDAASGYICIVRDLDRGGIFKAVNSGTANNGTIFASATSGWTWQRIFDGPVNIKWFGAVGDGVTDDTSAIQAAFDGIGSNYKSIDFGDSKNEFLLTYQASSHCIYVNGKTDFEIIGNGAKITVTEDATSNSVFAINFRACKRFSVHGLHFECSFSGTPSTFTVTTALFISDDGVNGSEDVDIYNNIFDVQHSEGGNENRAVRSIYALTDSNTLTLTKNIKVFDNTFKNCDGRVVQFLAVNGGAISDNYFQNLGTNGGYSAVRILNDSSNIIISGNIGYDTSGVTLTLADSAIYIAAGVYGSGAGRVPHDINVCGNSFIQSRQSNGGTQPYGVYLSQVKDISIQSNFISYINASLVYSGRGIEIANGAYYDANKISTHVKCIDNVISGYQLSPERISEIGATNIKFSNTYLDHSSLSGFFQIPSVKDNADCYTRQFEKLEKGFGGICQNLVKYSENLENSSWLKTNVTITQAGTNPIENGKCNSVLETADTGQHYFYQSSVSFETNTTYVFSARVKANGRNVIEILLPAANFGGQLLQARFDLSNLSHSIQSGNGSSQIIGIGNDWYLIRACGFCQSTGTGDVIMRFYNEATDYAGDITKGMYVYGCQLNKNGIIPYAYTDNNLVDNFGGSFGLLRASSANFSEATIGLGSDKITSLAFGTATLVAGQATVSDARVKSTSKIFITTTTPSGTVTLLHVSAIVDGVSFDVDGTSASDNSTFSYLILN